MKNNVKPTVRKISKGRALFFKILLILFPLFFFILLEGSLRLLNYGHDFSLFVTNPEPSYERFKVVNPDIAAKYFRTIDNNRPRNDMFLKNKKENTFRIFVLGSSSVFGFPYDGNLMFTRILQNRLESAYPDKKIEIINTAITAINSYTLLGFTDDILKEKPDAILLYAGHNEYYGAFGTGSNIGVGESRPLILLHLKLMDLRFYQLLRNVLYWVSGPSGKNANTVNRGTLMSKVVKKADIVYNGPDYHAGLRQFRSNMSAILEKASGHNVPVFISTLVSNTSGLKPFGSDKTGGGENAEVIFEKAKEAENKSDFQTAKSLYIRARDLDCVRFRASSDINVAIEELARKHNASLVPMLKAFEDKSPNGIVGNNLLTEHVHPNIEGYFLMADVFYNSISSSGIIDKEVNKYTARQSDEFRRTYGYTALDSLLGHHRITSLSYHWPFRDESEDFIDYRLIYKPKGKIDSLAFTVMAKQSLLSLDAHLQLADEYNEKRDLINAGREYMALIQMVPYTPELLREAADFFLKTADLPFAYKCYVRSLDLNPSYLAYFRAGEICMIQNDFAKASRFFTKAFEISDDEYKGRILTKLYTSYIYQNKTDEAKQVLEILLKFQPGAKIQVPPKSYTFGNYIPYPVREKVFSAKEFLKEKKLDEAIPLLTESLKITDSPVVSRILGEVFFEQKDFTNAAFYLNKAYNWFCFEPGFLILSINANIGNSDKNIAKSQLEQLRIIEPDNPAIGLLQQLL